MNPKLLYNFQEIAVGRCRGHFSHGARAVCLVSPPGSGKTEMGAAIVGAGEKKALWVVSGRELVEQAAGTLRERAGRLRVGVLMAGVAPDPQAKIQVASIETLLSRECYPDVELLVFDECHHVMADTYRELYQRYSQVPCIGLTATPERYDGRPLGDVFDTLVVAANYSDLLPVEGKKTYAPIVPWMIFAPERNMGHDFAEDPVNTFKSLSGYGHNNRTFAYWLRVQLTEEYADRFRLAGVRSDTVTAHTSSVERASAIENFRLGRVSMIHNVYTMTEGVNVPECSIVMLGRPFEFVGGFLQACGRGGRSAEGKTHALLIDLCGSSLVHGSPVQDREYSLEGRAITPKPNKGGGGGTEFREPVVREGRMCLSEDSTFVVPAPPVPEKYLPRPNAKRLDEAIRNRRGVSRRTKETVRKVLGGLADGNQENSA